MINILETAKKFHDILPNISTETLIRLLDGIVEQPSPSIPYTIQYLPRYTPYITSSTQDYGMDSDRTTCPGISFDSNCKCSNNIFQDL